MALITIKCPQCGAPLHFQDNTSRATCEYCGAIVEDDVLREIQKQAIEKREAEKETFKKGFLSKSLWIFAAIAFVFFIGSLSFVRVGINKYFPSLLITLSQTILFIASWLMGMNIIKTKDKNTYMIVMVAALLLVIPFFIFMP